MNAAKKVVNVLVTEAQTFVREWFMKIITFLDRFRSIKIILVVLLLSSGIRAEVAPGTEPDIHSRITAETALPDEVHDRFTATSKSAAEKTDQKYAETIDILSGQSTLYRMEVLSLQSQIKDMEYNRNLEKKIMGIAGLIIFASGNESLKSVGLVGLFCWSIW